MSSAERAAGLRAQADALERLAELEADLATAKSAHAADPTPESKAAKQETALALRQARALVREDGVAVGGDAFISTEGD
ncbi:hypothetical protein [Nonomuraea typhae]|uniref:hypothetical protein n=1 Tax=Nonomuraea typhae TaxID=2603600 RepID=UPI0012F7D3BC|nr:hypothetical protein [Nonomuraea typhae]